VTHLTPTSWSTILSQENANGSGELGVLLIHRFIARLLSLHLGRLLPFSYFPLALHDYLIVYVMYTGDRGWIWERGGGGGLCVLRSMNVTRCPKLVWTYVNRGFFGWRNTETGPMGGLVSIRVVSISWLNIYYYISNSVTHHPDQNKPLSRMAWRSVILGKRFMP